MAAAPAPLCSALTCPPASSLAQLQLELRLVAGRDALRQALLAMVPQIDELQKKRELMKQQQQQQQRQQQMQIQMQMQQQQQQLQRQSSDAGLSGLGPLQPVKMEGSSSQVRTDAAAPPPAHAASSRSPPSRPKLSFPPFSQADGSGASSSTADGNGAVKPEGGADGAVKTEGAAGQPLVKQEAGSAAVPGQPGQVAPSPVKPEGGVANGGVAGGVAPPGAAGPSGAPAAAGGSSSQGQGRKSTLPVQALVHAFHCSDPGCQQKTCADTKQVLKRMEVHVAQCPARRNAQAAGAQPLECKVCKLWQALHKTKSSSGQGQVGQPRPGQPPAGRGMPMGNRPPGAPGTAQNQEAVRARLRQIDPAQVKRMLLSHVRACQNKQCQTCHKLRERIKSRAAAGQGLQPGRPGVPGMGGGGMPMGMGMGGGMGGSFNPLAGGGFGGGGWGGGGGMDGGGGGWGGAGMQPHMMQRPPQQPGQRRGIKRRGWEGAGGNAVGAARGPKEETVRYSKVKLKLQGAPDWKKVALSMQPARSKQTKKRASSDGADAPGVSHQASGSGQNKRRRDSSATAKAIEEEEDLGHQIKPATNRHADLEQNTHESDSLIEVQLTPESEWKLARVRGCTGAAAEKLYTVQLEPADQHRQKPSGISSSQLRLCCDHTDCRKHALQLAALPLFCDRCRKALMQSPQQRIYFQETYQAMVNAGGQTTIRLCNTCHQHLRNEQKKGQEAFKQDLSNFTREIVGGERTKLLLGHMEECQVPQRTPDSGDAPIMSHDMDARWVQCEHCHKWRHWVCAMYDDNQYKQKRPYYCEHCKEYEAQTETIRELMSNSDAVNLPQIPMGDFIEEQVAKDIAAASITCEPVTVRVVSSLLMTSYTPPKLVQHMEALHEPFPKEFPYKSKALLAFQKRGGMDVCIFALYTQEYGPDCPEPNRNRVYISYLDSVRYFESSPVGHRSTVYHSVLVAYLQWTRMLGFKHVHIWVEPPKMGDEYIFFARSDQQRKPMKREKLRDWYKKMLDKAKEKGIVDHYCSMHEHYAHLKTVAEIPLFHGDQWEITVPSLLGIDTDEPDPKKTKAKVDVKALLRMDAKDVVQKAQQEMQHLKRHFLVVVMNDPEEAPKRDEDPVISTDLTDTRQSFLGQCQSCHWQFNSMRHAQYATMMILQHIHNKPSYCLESCARGRVEDGSFMVGCDNCDNWYHGDCVGVSKEAASTLQEYLCPRCKEKGVGGAPSSSGGGGDKAQLLQGLMG